MEEQIILAGASISQMADKMLSDCEDSSNEE